MLQAWLSIGYIILLAILPLAFILWRRGAPFWPSLRSWWVSPSGLDGNMHVLRGPTASSRELKCDAAIPTLAAIRATSTMVVIANHHILWPLRLTLAQLFLRLLQAASIECALARWQVR
jgi:hypothetical protein